MSAEDNITIHLNNQQELQVNVEENSTQKTSVHGYFYVREE